MLSHLVIARGSLKETAESKNLLKKASNIPPYMNGEHERLLKKEYIQQTIIDC